MLACLLPREERFQLFGDDAVQNSLFRLAGNIFEATVQHAEALGRSSANSSHRRIIGFLNSFIRKS